MDKSTCDSIWVFNGNGGNIFPSAVFSSKEKAIKWIKATKVSGVLTQYPVDIAVYDWAIANEFFTPKTEQQKTAQFIQNFSSASMEHYHFEDGE